MRRRRLWFNIAIALGATSCWPQAISRLDPKTQAAQTVPRFSITGTVVNSVTGEPIRRAQVQAGDSAAMTDAEGRFELHGIPEGYTRVMARKPGYFNEDELGHYASTPMLQVGPASAAVTVKLIPAAVITGMVRSSKGEPLEGIFVDAIFGGVVDGRKRWESVASAQTDEDGAFRIARLTPGSYYLMAARANGYPRFASGSDRPTGPAPTYFPDVADRDSATAIQLKPGQQATADFELHETPLFDVRGKVNGIPATGGINVQIVDNSGQPPSVQPSLDAGTGNFEIKFLPPGKYRFQATGQDGNNTVLYGETAINLDRDLDDVQVSLQPLPSIAVEVREIPSGRDSGPQIQSLVDLPDNVSYPVQVWLKPVGSTSGAGYASQIENTPAGKKYVLRNVRPGTYAVDVNAGDWYADSISCGGSDLLREELTVTPKLSDPIEITLRHDAAVLSAQLKGPGEPTMATLLVVPETQPNNIRVIPNVQNGFSMGGLAPGEYALVAIPQVEELEYRNPEILRPYLSQATHATLYPNQATKVEINVAVAPQ